MRQHVVALCDNPGMTGAAQAGHDPPVRGRLDRGPDDKDHQVRATQSPPEAIPAVRSPPAQSAIDPREGSGLRLSDRELARIEQLRILVPPRLDADLVSNSAGPVGKGGRYQSE